MIKELKTEKPETREFVCMLRLHEHDIDQVSL